MNNQTCFFIGHRDSPDEVYPLLLSAVEQHITQYGVKNYIVGNCGRFDFLAAKAVAHCKKAHSDIALFMLLPYHPVEHPVALPNEFDGSFYPHGMEGVPRAIAILKANRYVVDRSNFLISYVRYPASNTSNLLEYAQRREKKGQLKITVLNTSDRIPI